LLSLAHAAARCAAAASRSAGEAAARNMAAKEEGGPGGPGGTSGATRGREGGAAGGSWRSVVEGGDSRCAEGGEPREEGTRGGALKSGGLQVPGGASTRGEAARECGRGR
jgi:hypothetical protein